MNKEWGKKLGVKKIAHTWKVYYKNWRHRTVSSDAQSISKKWRHVAIYFTGITGPNVKLCIGAQKIL